MQKQMYSIEINGEVLYHDLFKNEAIGIARREASAGKQVFVTWFRKSDGQHGYLNRDGNHAITGEAWQDAQAISTAAATLGRKGGSVVSEAKTAAARANGKRGGRPKKTEKTD